MGDTLRADIVAAEKLPARIRHWRRLLQPGHTAQRRAGSLAERRHAAVRKLLSTACLCNDSGSSVRAGSCRGSGPRAL